MKVYLIRHAAAVHGASVAVDDHRHLTAVGRADAVAVGDVLAREKVQFDLLLTSPLLRAAQTAELLAARVGFGGVIECLPQLQPGISPEAIALAIAGRSTGAIALVGHEPTISALGALLSSRPTFPPMRPAQVALLEDGKPVWTLRPDTLELERLLVY